MGNALAKDAYGRPPDLLEGVFCYLNDDPTRNQECLVKNIQPWSGIFKKMATPT